MAKTSQQIQVNREQVRMLAIQIGLRPAARKLGLNEDTVCSWASRDNWFVAPANPQPIKAQALQARPGDVLLDEIAECEKATRLGLARYSKRAAQSAETATLRDSPYVHKAAQVAGIAFKWDAKEQNQNTVVNVAILGVDPATVSVDTSPIIDVESRVSE